MLQEVGGGGGGGPGRTEKWKCSWAEVCIQYKVLWPNNFKASFLRLGK